MLITNPDKIKIGIVEGGGSGGLLVELFENFLRKVAQEYCQDKQIEFIYPKSDNNTLRATPFGSYESIKERATTLKKSQINDKETTLGIQELSIEEATDLTSLYKKWHREGVQTIFRTAINAEALYQMRVNLMGVKEILITANQIEEGKSKDKKILIVRDQTQGFYASDEYEIVTEDEGKEKIVFSGHISQEKIKKIIPFAESRAKERLNGNFQTWITYKHHLFGNRIESWIKAIDSTIKVYQPDTGFTCLFDYMRDKDNSKNLLFIAGNEIGDLLYEPFIEILNSTGRKLDLYSKTFFLKLKNEESAKYLCEYQTVHGSADDLIKAKKEENVKPFATLRIAASIAELNLGLVGFREIFDKAMAKINVKLLKKEIDSHPYQISQHIWEEITHLHHK